MSWLQQTTADARGDDPQSRLVARGDGLQALFKGVTLLLRFEPLASVRGADDRR